MQTTLGSMDDNEVHLKRPGKGCRRCGYSKQQNEDINSLFDRNKYFTDMVHSEIAQNRSAGAGTAKKYDAIVTRQFCECAKEALRITKPK